MARNNNRNTGANSTRRGGRQTKVDGNAANVAPEGNAESATTEPTVGALAEALEATDNQDGVIPEGEGIVVSVGDAEVVVTALPEGTEVGTASDELPEPDAAHAITEGPTAEDAKTVEQPAEVAADDAEKSLEDAQSEHEADDAAQSANDADKQPEGGPASADEVPADSPEPETVDTDGDKPEGEQPEQSAEQQPEQPAPEPVDPFANLPMTKIEDYEFRDLSTAETSDPRKYESVQAAAREGKLPMKPNWKHATAMVTHGRSTREFKAGSVYGTIDQIVRSYGRAGVPAYVLVTKVRQAQIGNKRSHYCTSLPPIGWAEGWIDTYISKSHGKVMEKKAPPITVQEVAEIAKADAKAEAKGDDTNPEVAQAA